MSVKQALTFSDLDGLGSSPDSVRSRFQSIYGKRPDGIALNSETYFNAVKPAITEQYGLSCYKVLGDFTYTEGPAVDQGEIVVGSQSVLNYGDQEATMTVNVNGSWTQSTTVTSSITTGMSFTAEFAIEGVFKLGGSFNMSVTAGRSSTDSKTLGQSVSVSVTVPARSRVQVKMVGQLKQEAVSFTAPIRASGEFGANFSDRVKGHYFWFNNAEQVLNKTSGILSGSVKRASAFNVQTTIDPAEPIKG
ncbi:hydralysin-like [Oscarella lobularis]|uniref:hydralysin-like n=1 Tax=Oscarella lobularis TaxID=121494 RepID=UPI0033136257